MSAPTQRPSLCPHCGSALDSAVFAAAGEPRCPRCNQPLQTGAAGKHPVLWKLFGVGLVVLGALTIYYWGYRPWQEIQEMAPKISLSLKALFGGPLILGLGLAFLLPERPKEGETESLLWRLTRKLVLLLMLGGSAAGIGAYFWLRALARSRGYEF